jgi:PAS domain S-box-containing protein
MPIVYANHGFEQVTGYTPEEVLGRNCRFLQGDDHEQDGVQQIRTAIAAKQPCLLELTNYMRNGQLFRNRLSLTPVFDSHGDMIFMIGL